MGASVTTAAKGPPKLPKPPPIRDFKWACKFFLAWCAIGVAAWMELMILALPMSGTEGLAKDQGYLRFGAFIIQIVCAPILWRKLR